MASHHNQPFKCLIGQSRIMIHNQPFKCLTRQTPCAHTPLWVSSAPLVGFLLPCVGPFATLCGLFSGGSHDWFTGYMNRLLSLLCLFVCVCAGVPGGLSSNRYGFVLVHCEIFNSKGCLVGSGLGCFSHLELFLTIPLEIWG